MPAERWDQQVERGEDSARFVLTWKNPDGSAVNLTGYTAKMEVRNGKADAPGSVVLTFSSTTGSPPRITLGGAAGTITVVPTSADLQTLTAGNDYCYELVAYDAAGKRYPLIYGSYPAREWVNQS